MPTREELDEAIEQIESQPCNFDNCFKLAIFYQLRDRFESPETGPEPGEDYAGDSEFIKIINRTGIKAAVPLIAELVECVQITCPAMYDSFILKLKRGEA